MDRLNVRTFELLSFCKLVHSPLAIPLGGQGM